MQKAEGTAYWWWRWWCRCAAKLLLFFPVHSALRIKQIHLFWVYHFYENRTEHTRAFSGVGGDHTKCIMCYLIDCCSLHSSYVPFNGFKSPLFEWCDDAVEFGVVDTVDIGEPGRISFGVVLPADLLSVLINESELLDTFCWASRSCFRNLARRFWNQTYKTIWTRKCVITLVIIYIHFTALHRVICTRNIWKSIKTAKANEIFRLSCSYSCSCSFMPSIRVAWPIINRLATKRLSKMCA